MNRRLLNIDTNILKPIFYNIIFILHSITISMITTIPKFYHTIRKLYPYANYYEMYIDLPLLIYYLKLLPDTTKTYYNLMSLT